MSGSAPWKALRYQTPRAKHVINVNNNCHILGTPENNIQYTVYTGVVHSKQYVVLNTA